MPSLHAKQDYDTALLLISTINMADVADADAVGPAWVWTMGFFFGQRVVPVRLDGEAC